MRKVEMDHLVFGRHGKNIFKFNKIQSEILINTANSFWTNTHLERELKQTNLTKFYNENEEEEEETAEGKLLKICRCYYRCYCFTLLTNKQYTLFLCNLFFAFAVVFLFVSILFYFSHCKNNNGFSFPTKIVYILISTNKNTFDCSKLLKW